MAFNPNAVDQIDQTTVESDGPQYPVIQWVYGDPKQRKAGGMDYQGGFFISEANAPGDMTAYGWEKTSWIHDDGSETEGFYRREAAFSIMHTRKRWEVRGDNGRRSNYAWKDYDKASAAGRASGRTHFLVLVKGAEGAGPFILTTKGVAAMHIEGTRNVPGALPHFVRTVIAAANKLTKKGRWPYRAFWFTLGADRDGKGEPVFTEVGQKPDTSNIVMPIAIGLPQKPEQVNLDDYYVGGEILTQVNDLYTENLAWATAWDTIEPGTVEGDEKADADAAPDVAVDAIAAAGAGL